MLNLHHLCQVQIAYLLVLKVCVMGQRDTDFAESFWDLLTAVYDSHVQSNNDPTIGRKRILDSFKTVIITTMNQIRQFLVLDILMTI